VGDDLPSAALQAEFNHDGRPSKRRKVSARKMEAEPNHLWDDAVILACVTLNLRFNDENTLTRIVPESQISERPVNIWTNWPDGCRFKPRSEKLDSFDMSSKHGNFKAHIQLASDVKGRTRKILRHAINVYSTFNRTKYARTDCTLRQKVTNDGGLSHQLEVRISYRNSRNMGEYTLDKAATQLLEILFDESRLDDHVMPMPQDFYDSVHVPDAEGDEAREAAQIHVEGLNSKLYPFQQRTTAWLLRREGVDLKGNTLPPQAPPSQHGFIKVSGLDGQIFYINSWLGAATTREYVFKGAHTTVRGGLLAEEMGLGKTVEIVALMLLNRRRSAEVGQLDSSSLTKSKATLIISPVSIQQQWKSEIEVHAPELRVMIYDGVKSMAKDASEQDMVDRLMCYDVVLCSYTVLSGEIYYASVEPERKLRHAKQYEKRRSPLVLIDWWRCVLDECQMVESGVSQAAQTANQIPRQNAWAVSGTPMRKDAKDLYGLLTYLRIQPYNYTHLLFERLTWKYKDIFRELFSTIALRHTKGLIKAELELPRQSRFVINMPFTPVEENHYSTMFQEMCSDCELSIEGAPLKEDWNPNDKAVVEKMRSWLARLRQTVLHPEVGDRNRRALGQSHGPLRTVEEVLQVMTDQNDAALRAEERNWLLSKLKRGQVFEQAKKSQDALDVWLNVLGYSAKLVDECREELEKETMIDNAKEAAKEIEREDEKAGEEEDERSQTRLGTLRNRLRTTLEVLHMATFFTGNAYYQLRSDESAVPSNSEKFKELEELETSAYERAKQIRKEMLVEPLSRANNYMSRIQKRDFVHLAPFKELLAGGMESRNIVDKAEILVEVMNMQAKKIVEWRQAMIDLLLVPLLDQEEAELQGDEYETSTKQQDEQYTYMEVLRAIVADRADHISGQENGLVKRDMDINLHMARKDEGPSPKLMIELLNVRQQLAPKPRMGFVRGVVAELRGLRTELERLLTARADKELTIVDKALVSLQSSMTKQTKEVLELEKEVELFRDCMNARLEFYRQLQRISDGVAPFEEEMTQEAYDKMLELMAQAEEPLEDKIESLKSRARYLEHLKTESNVDEGPSKCIICQDTINVGVLLSCGHTFDSECIRLWYGTHKTCPMCKKKLKRKDFHPITYKPSELTAQEEPNAQIDSPDERSNGNLTSIYTGLNTSTLNEIKNIDIHGSFGTKIDTLARHIIWLRTADPGAKSIIFSQFRDFLEILARAFRRFKIGYSTIDDKKQGIERFKKDSTVECFFLHAKAHASGLNLVNATHVFLCEPLINTALELQAIARVHRIGQHNQTSVYMYLVEDTVEKAIYDISVRRRMEHISRAAEGSLTSKKGGHLVEDDIETANSLEIQEATVTTMLASGRSAGEMVDKQDLWQCLFGVSSMGRSKASEEAQKAVAGFLGAEAAEDRASVNAGGPAEAER
jgi:E3 ubiquitin-protein ligase SHPRH